VMDKNSMDKFSFIMTVGVFLISIFVAVIVVKQIHEISYSMGVMAEKIGTLEEMVPVTKVQVSS